MSINWSSTIHESCHYVTADKLQRTRDLSVCMFRSNKIKTPCTWQSTNIKLYLHPHHHTKHNKTDNVLKDLSHSKDPDCIMWTNRNWLRGKCLHIQWGLKSLTHTKSKKILLLYFYNILTNFYTWISTDILTEDNVLPQCNKQWKFHRNQLKGT